MRLSLVRRLILTVLAASCAAALIPGIASASVERTLCVYDPSGAVGDAYQLMKDYRNEALAWGVTFELKPYTDEKTAAEDLKAGKCHVALLTGVRARGYNRFSGTVEAMGALTNYDQLETAIKLLANPKIASKMKSGDYETLAVFPAGAVYLYVRDRSIDSVSELAGKRIATMDFDLAAQTMVDRAGATMVPADIGTFAGMFNNGSVDACYAPATAFRPLELGKGVGRKGGLIKDYPTAMLTLQVLAGGDADLPDGVAAKSRKWAADNFDRMITLVKKAERDIPNDLWISLPEGDVKKYDELFRDVRIKLRGEEYDGTMLALLRRVRCSKDPGRAECAEKKE